MSPLAVAISFYTQRLPASDQTEIPVTHQGIDFCVHLALLLFCFDFDLFRIVPEVISAAS